MAPWPCFLCTFARKRSHCCRYYCARCDVCLSRGAVTCCAFRATEIVCHFVRGHHHIEWRVCGPQSERHRCHTFAPFDSTRVATVGLATSPLVPLRQCDTRPVPTRMAQCGRRDRSLNGQSKQPSHGTAIQPARYPSHTEQSIGSIVPVARYASHCTVTALLVAFL